MDKRIESIYTRAGFTEKEYATMTSLLGRLTDILENRELTTNERNSGNLL